MARKASLWATGWAVLALGVAGCAGGSGDSSGENTTGPASGTPSAVSSCDTVSPNSPGEQDCQAAGIPGETVSPDRCGGDATPGPDGLIEGTFGSYCDGAVASTYNTAQIPDDAEAILTVSETEADTTVKLQAQGFQPDTGYTGRLHQKACGASASDAGEEEVDPQDAGSGGLVLDFTTDPSGSATVSSTVPWTVPDNGDGESLLIYEVTGSNGMGEAAGCVNLGR